MPRPKLDQATITARISKSAKAKIDEICLDRGWVYGRGLPKLSELLARVSKGEVVKIDGKEFLVVPLDNEK